MLPTWMVFVATAHAENGPMERALWSLVECIGGAFVVWLVTLGALLWWGCSGPPGRPPPAGRSEHAE
jgi:hypothetical protein